jgi:quercetin dioxygenase-like cupin family protein
VPIHEGFGLDLLGVETGPWPRLGCGGALILLEGRGDFVDCQLLDLAPGSQSDPQRHLHEEVVYVLEGRGGTTVEGPDRKDSFEWGTGSLFALPPNTSYRHFNTSGQKRARLAAVTNLPLLLKAFHDRDFVFANVFQFPERLGAKDSYRGEGEFILVRPGRHQWETNFVPDLRKFELQAWDSRGVGSSNIKFVMADSTMHAHMSELAVGTYKKAHRHGPDFHIFPVTGRGYSLFWREGDADHTRIDWRHGWVYAPPDQVFHQHFNTDAAPSRYVAIAYGSIRYPFTFDKRELFGGGDRSVSAGGRQIEYEDEDPRIGQTFRRELALNGVRPDPRMEEIWSNRAPRAT